MKRLRTRVLLAAALCACAAPTESVRRPATLSVAPATYAAGAMVSAALTNRSAQDISHRPCRALIERRVGSGWVLTFPLSNVGICNETVQVLTPGAIGTVDFLLSPELTPGTYRLRQEISLLGAARPNWLIRSREFTVSAP